MTFSVPMLLPVIDSTPSINYQEMYHASNRLLDDLGYRLAVCLSDRGHASVFLPRDGYGSVVTTPCLESAGHPSLIGKPETQRGIPDGYVADVRP